MTDPMGQSAEAPQEPLLLRTKLLPPPHHELVRRNRLRRMLASSSSQLTLVVAPAGWGKTSLLGEWAAQEAAGDGRESAWLALDEGDNDHVRFWSYAVEALNGVQPEIGESALRVLPTRGSDVPDLFLPALINDIERVHRRVFLMLDDYHTITNGDIHRSVGFLLEHMPPSLRLVLASRFDPPLPVPRLHARRDVLEVRENELRFTEEEAAALLNDVLGLELSSDEAARLQQRTEGWAAGLCLAALSLRGRDDARSFIEEFAGDDRHIVDYLGEEVLQRQTEAVRTFLLRTSILQRMCGPLCDAVLEAATSSDTLEELERKNLFLVPLDSKRVWYRYHHLFGELLRHSLRTTRPDLEESLHRRASGWFRDHGLTQEAINHALSSRDLADAAELVAVHWNPFFNRGRLTTVTNWLDSLPESIVEADARLCVARAWLASDEGRLEDVPVWTDAADRAAVEGSAGPDASPISSHTAILRTVRLFKIGDLASAHASAKAAVGMPHAERSFTRTVAQILLGVTGYWLDEKATREALEEAVRLGRETNNNLGTIYALGYLALLQAEAGSIEEADLLLKEVEEIIAAGPGAGEHFVAMTSRLALIAVRERQARSEEADAAAARAVELSRRGAGRVEIAAALLASSERSLAGRDAEGSRRLLEAARGSIRDSPDPGVLGERIERMERRHRRRPAGGVAIDPAGVRAELTEREAALLRLLVTELTRREMAASLYISQNTVKTQLKSIYRKLGVSSREEAVRRAGELGLL